MRLFLGKANEKFPKHVVLLLNPREAANVGNVIYEVLGPNKRAHRELSQGGSIIKYRFHINYLETLMLALPQAEKSPGLQKRLDRLTPRELIDENIPELKIPGFKDRKAGSHAKPFGFQAIAIDWCVRYLLGEIDLEEAETLLENDEMGLGKTLIGLCTIAMLKPKLKLRRVLIVAPKNGKYVWQRENERWTGMDLVVIDADKQRPETRNNLIAAGHFITVVNPEALRGTEYPDEEGVTQFRPTHPALFDEDWDLVIFDEYHRFGSPTSQQSKGMFRLQSKKWLPMSGTPYSTRPQQLWPILHRCYPGRYPDYDLYVDALTLDATDGSGKVAGYRPKVMKELKLFIQDRSIRRRKDQVMAQLPEVFPVEVPIELNREQRRIYNQIRDRMKMELEDGTLKNIFQVRPRLIRLKQACFSPELFGGSKHSAKIDELGPVLRSLVDSGEKAILYSEWKKATRILMREFGEEYDAAYVDGTIPASKRMEQADKFNESDRCRLYIGTIGANKEAISLGAASQVLFTDLDWSFGANDQAIKRSAAGGLRGLDSKVKQVSVVEFFGADTYEDRVRGVVGDARATFAALIERDGGKPTKRLRKELAELI